jgi:hypothetical protein
MSNKNVTLKDTSSNSLFPKTLTQNVFNSSNESVDSSLATINAKLATKIEFSENDIPSATPSALDDYYNKSATDALLNEKANNTLSNLGTINPTLTSSSVTINSKAGTKYVGGHFVVESWKATDGTQWYRKYSDGFIEMGIYLNNTTGSNSYNIAFPISFSTTNYFTNIHMASYSQLSGTNSATEQALFRAIGNIVSMTTSSITLQKPAQHTFFYACGY